MKTKFEASAHGILSDEQAQVVGVELERIEKKLGAIEPESVVESARDSKSPLHDYFTWDNTQAAAKCRLHEARQLVGSVIRVQVTKSDADPVRVRAFVSVVSTEEEDRFEGRAYRSVGKVMKEPEYREQILSRAYDELQSWKQRYQSLKEFSQVVEVIEQIELPALV